MVSDVSGGVVQILTRSGTGSGFIIDADGLVVTNAHVVQGFDTVDVRLPDGQTHQGEVLYVDRVTDLALLDLRASRDFEPVTLGDSDAIAVGEDVIAIGYPLGDVKILLGSPTITRGIVSAKRVSDAGVKLLQTDAAINPGSSGGPLFDRDGRVVGVNTSKLSESGDGRPVEGIGMAVAINEVRDGLDILARGGGGLTPTPIQSTTDRTHTQASIGSFVSVSAGGLHSCGVKTDGSVRCWGSDESTEGDFLGQSTPPGDMFASVSAGVLHSCGVKVDGSVACWGDDSEGQSTPPTGSFSSVSAGVFHSCGVRVDGSAKCWGKDIFQFTSPPGSFISVSAGSLHTCGVETDGSVGCWGIKTSGQTRPPSGSFVSVSAGFTHTCGVKMGGSIACWGSNEDSDGNFRGQSTPPGGSFVSVSAGVFHSCGVKADGFVECWGSNTSGQSTPPRDSLSGFICFRKRRV